MKIIIIPESESPYSKLLIESLRESGHQVDTLAPKGFQSLFHAVRRFGKPDLIHLQWQHRLFIGPNYPVALVKTSWFFLQWLILRLSGVRFVWTVHNIVNHERKQVQWELAACRILARVVDAMIVLCDAARPKVASAYGVSLERLQVVPHGTFDSLLPDNAAALEKGSARRRLSISEGTVFLFFGYIRQYKGLDQLVQAFASIDANVAELIVVGKPATIEMADWLRTAAQNDDRLRIDLSYLPDDRLASYVAACDVVVLPYRDSLASGVVFFAAAFGRPIIAPIQGCVQEYPSEAGILYSPNDPEGLDRSLRAALNADLDAMGIAARAYSATFPWSMVASKTLTVYERALMRSM